MVLTTVIVLLGLLAGWLAGLTLHAFRALRWEDPGARAAWASAAALGGSLALLAALLLCAATRSLPWLLVPAGCAATGTIIGWHACQAIQPRPPGDRKAPTV
jgi:hypothetical protein